MYDDIDCDFAKKYIAIFETLNLEDLKKFNNDGIKDFKLKNNKSYKNKYIHLVNKAK